MERRIQQSEQRNKRKRGNKPTATKRNKINRTGKPTTGTTNNVTERRTDPNVGKTEQQPVHKPNERSNAIKTETVQRNEQQRDNRNERT
jgi:hypothetical protein